MTNSVLNNKNINEWIPQSEACKLLNIQIKTLKKYCNKGLYTFKIVPNGKKNIYYIHLKSLPLSALCKIKNNSDDKMYDEAPDWAKNQADKYIILVKKSLFIKGQKLINEINNWNFQHPDETTTYSSVLRMRQRYYKNGIDGLLSKRGFVKESIIKEDYFNYFKSIYLVEGAASLQSCYDVTLGYAMKTDKIKKEDFPSKYTFLRRLEKEVPPQAIYLSRYGESAYNRKFGNYFNRDYSMYKCGQIWVSDHAQIDVAVLDENGKPTFPWVTAWRDYKSGKWLGWTLQCGSPNSDRIFQAFYYAADTYGLPKDVIIDNGKDYRCKDFAGGRPKFVDDVKIETDQSRATSMLDKLNVQVHFAKPYNAQTKPIERDFNTIKNIMSKHCIGYRGGNVVERPEKLLKEIKAGKLYTIDKFREIFNSFIIEVLNKKPSEGINTKGKSRDQVFEDDFTEKIVTSREALKLFCMRTSKNYTIARNGIIDRSLDITYWADWMVSKMKTKVYLRRDPKNYKEAWVFKADNDEFLGKCKVIKAVPALYANEISKEEFQEAMAIKQRSLKATKAYLKGLKTIPFEEQCENYKIAYAQVNKELKPHVTRLANTEMDKVIQKNKEMEAYGKYDMSMFLNDEKPKKKFYFYETDKYLDEEEDLMEVAYGY